ncbi:MAG: hypothetical protein CME88_17805 [Hirschia sp.]|nr:hypothetical protein [Hirschia sp.]MBF19092.1 hypothetical protein [Hirschia sp.]MBF20226.1 hypothetical protein [Hirschia sp.]|tara:strand:- start:607 stop:1011 length:405 start_codon:yes stop_codon:yes gene_type:complete
MALIACASTGPQTASSFMLPTGIEIALVEGTSPQPECDFYDKDEDITPEIATCVEFDASEGENPLDLYAQALTAAGYERTGGADNVHWFKVPVEAGCRQSLNLVEVPKFESQTDDAAKAGTYVIAVVAEPKRCG